jgi:hypothetical protein
MKKTKSNLALLAVALAWSGLLLFTGTSSATLDMQKKAKAEGFPAENCMYCHGEKLPKKGAVTYNGRGEWLIAEKEKRHAKAVDVAWLKYYKESDKK